MIEVITLLLVIATLGFVVAQHGGVPSISLKRQRKIILDSCALIDGRIVELIRTGFVTDEIIVPKFILRELQTLADGNDSHKRERARFGLEVVVQLQELTSLKIDDTNYSTVRVVDDKLVLLAKDRSAALCTTDFNLNKVATVEGVKVLNVNELSHALRPVILPGEQQTIKIVQKGNNKNQGVGYLEDGTMVVVDGGSKYIGKSVVVTIEHMLQTVAGKMVFARLRSTNTDAAPSLSHMPTLSQQTTPPPIMKTTPGRRLSSLRRTHAQLENALIEQTTDKKLAAPSLRRSPSHTLRRNNKVL